MRRADLLSGAFWNGAELDCLRRGKEARCDLLFDPGKKLLDLVASIDDVDGNGEIFSQPFDLEGVNHAGVGAESHKPTVDGSPGELSRVGLCNDPFIERMSGVFVSFSDVDSQ